jgi:hypothetical protein
VSKTGSEAAKWKRKHNRLYASPDGYLEFEEFWRDCLKAARHVIVEPEPNAQANYVFRDGSVMGEAHGQTFTIRPKFVEVWAGNPAGSR